MHKKIIDGNEACAIASYMFTEVAGIYPITPSSPMPEHIDLWASSGKKNIFGNSVKIAEMQSEAGAIGMVHGSLQSGLLTSTYTASQGLLLMIPNMYKIAGEMMPCTMHVAARTIATHALSIFGDHSDVYATRGTGFCMLASSSVEDAYYMAIVAHLSALKSSLPFMHFFDGFRTSHEINKINILEDDQIKELIDENALKAFREKALSINNPVTRGTNENGDIFFQHTESRNKYYEKAIDNVVEYMDKINSLSGTNYQPFNYYGSKNASKVIVAMGSVCETIKETIDYLNEEIGLVEVHLYRPFSPKYLLSALPKTVNKIAVLDRTKEAGSNGEPLYLDVVSALKDKDITVVGGRYGLSSKDTTPGMIKAVYDSLDNPQNNFTIGINDDVTNLSLDYSDLKTNNAAELILYGYGSDGTVSAAKSLIEIIGENTNKYVQGYFEYDSKKSGGVTVSHLRISDEKIKSTYFVHHPKLIVITKDTYLKEFDVISNIEKNGTILINTNKSDEEILKCLDPYKKILKENDIKIYKVDAKEIARSENLDNKISMIIESAIFYITNIINYNDALKYIGDFINSKFIKKGSEIAGSNIKAIQKVAEYLKEISLDNIETTSDESTNNMYDFIKKRKGNELKVSDFINNPDGTFKHTAITKSPISDITPKWINSNCLECGMCSLVCPHGVIRPFLLNEEEYQKAPSGIKEKCLKKDNNYYIISISEENCTGCGVCINTCPGKEGKKALEMGEFSVNSDFNYLVNNVTDKKLFKKETIKGSQFVKPKFAFHGACAGCGQTAYIKLLTQLFGDSLIIANATGCSSIYGGSIPDLPYEVPWSNSLFEDNAEYGYGFAFAHKAARDKIRNYMENNKDELFNIWLNNCNDYEVTKEIYKKIDYEKHPILNELKNYIVKPSIWEIGGDGWAYDIGFGGIDHVLSSGEDINILVLDSQVYSNTGGQASKSTPKGAIAKFAASGKKTSKKDLARIAMCYPNVYVAQISLGANMMQTLKALKEAEEHNGPSIVIAYTPCISHGIKGGMKESINIEKLAVKCGYFPIFRYDGSTFTLDSKNPDFNLYEEFLNSQTRYSMLKTLNEEKADQLLKANKENAIKRFEYYKNLSQ